MNDRYYFVYILTNSTHSVLYTGITNNLFRRVYEHREGLTPGFTSKYHVKKLVYFETTADVESAIVREKQIKAGSRSKKLALINKNNPNWIDLFQTLMPF